MTGVPQVRIYHPELERHAWIPETALRQHGIAGWVVDPEEEPQTPGGDAGNGEPPAGDTPPDQTPTPNRQRGSQSSADSGDKEEE